MFLVVWFFLLFCFALFCLVPSFEIGVYSALIAHLTSDLVSRAHWPHGLLATAMDSTGLRRGESSKYVIGSGLGTCISALQKEIL